MFGDNGYPKMQMITELNMATPSVSQYRALMPPKYPYESKSPLKGLLAAMLFWTAGNRMNGYRFYAGFFTRGMLLMASGFSAGYYLDRYFDQQYIGRYKAAVDYLRDNADLLEPVQKKKYKDPNNLRHWYTFHYKGEGC